MTTFTNKFLADGQVSSTLGSIYTATGTVLVKNIQLGNSQPATQSILLYRQHATDDARFWRRIQLRQFESADVLEGGMSLEMEAGDVLLALTSSDDCVDFSIDGVTLS